ncbi:DNA-binding transcriptional regulator, MarR family [Maridesulfovibrio ferrireducens]|uniref:DNA-binding transcriptional regulator, MarR family n=1 Tax=Maridesulfovibrio ferrireducens TaxID=246191 RepID=A0A1G9FRF7_9BACT|nr:MarR family winged helix-turn-helix transcriptional regulator [Maridesulfovibrio ferrireducens]SDK90979.1 DNA-binding transcriptional regulator, MarR family [Maridesulfovibrio ferrireducens]
MRKVKDVIPNMCSLGKVLSQYTMVAQKSFDFGIGMQLYPAEIHTLSTVERLGGGGVTEIAHESGVTKGAVSQLISKLVKKELCVKEKDPENGARVVIKLTALGKIAVDNHYNFHLEHDRVFLEYLRSMDDEKLQVFDDICRNMNKWMDNYLK